MNRVNEVKMPDDEQDFVAMLSWQPDENGRKHAPYNSWPEEQRWPVLSVNYLDDDEKWESTLTLIEGAANLKTFRQVEWTTIPIEVRRAVFDKEYSRRGYMMNWWFYWLDDGRVMARCQRKKELRTRLINLRRSERTDPENGLALEHFHATVRPGVIVVMGCDHEYEVVRLGRAYHGHKCVRCGHYYTIDSGD